MIIDFHAHIYPDNVAAKIFPIAMKKLKVEVAGTGLPNDLLSRMHKSGIDRSVILPLAKGKEDVASLNVWAQSHSGEDLAVFGAVHPFMDDLEEELDRLQALGCKGVKIMPLLQEVYPDDPRCSRLYESLIARDMILVTHAGSDPLQREEIYGTPVRFARMIEAYPDLKIVLAHLGGLLMWDDVRRHLVPADGKVCFDTAYVSFYLSQNEMQNMIGDIGADRVIFGSDYPWEDPGRAARIISELDLSRREMESILSKNALRLMDM